jgi:hypothetical protein
MVKNTSRKLLDRSCGWIKEHWNAENLDVPDRQRQMFPGGDDN